MSVFEKLSLNELKIIFKRNGLIPNGRDNWRKSYFLTLNKKKYQNLFLESSEVEQAGLTSDHLKEYKIVELNINSTFEENRKRKRETTPEESEKENADNEEPGKKKRKIVKKESCENVFTEKQEVQLTRWFLGNFQKYEQEILSRIIHNFKSEGEEHINRFINTINFLQKQDEVSCEKKTILKLIKDFHHEINVLDLIKNTSNGLDSIGEMIKVKYVEKIKPIVSDFTENYFRNILNNGTDIKDYCNSNFDVNENFFKGLLGENVFESPPSDKMISISLVNTNRKNYTYKCKKTTLLGKIATGYSTRTNSSLESLRLIFNGNHLDLQKSIGDNGLNDSDVVDVIINNEIRVVKKVVEKIIIYIETPYRTRLKVQVSRDKNIGEFIERLCFKKNWKRDLVTLSWKDQELAENFTFREMGISNNSKIVLNITKNSIKGVEKTINLIFKFSRDEEYHKTFPVGGTGKLLIDEAYKIARNKKKFTRQKNNLVVIFDGDKVHPNQSLDDLYIADEDILEVIIK